MSMTGAQFKKAIAALGMNQETAAAFLGLSLRAVNYYANDDEGHPIPLATAKLLRLMVRLNLKPEKVK